MVYSGLKSRANARASETWPTAGGTVLASDVEQRAHYSPKTRKTTYDYEPKIRYRYKVAGTDYESDVIRFGDLVRNSAKLPNELVSEISCGLDRGGALQSRRSRLRHARNPVGRREANPHGGCIHRHPAFHPGRHRNRLGIANLRHARLDPAMQTGLF